MQQVARYRAIRTLATIVTLVPVILAPVSAGAQPYETAELSIDFIDTYEAVWNDTGSGAGRDVSIWRPMPAEGWYRVGHHAKPGYEEPTEATMVVKGQFMGILIEPDDYTLIWNDAGSGANQDGSVWRPVCPDGYKAMGDVGGGSHEKPSLDEVRCVRDGALTWGLPGDEIWNDAGSDANEDFGAWRIQAPDEAYSRGLFYGADAHTRPADAEVAVLWVVKMTESAGETADAPTANTERLSAEYIRITGERVNAALAEEAQKEDILLAEASLTGLGWMALFGNGKDSAELAITLNEAVFNAYNGTEKIHIHMEQAHYSEMLNLNRFPIDTPVILSKEYYRLTRERVNAAMARGAGHEAFKLAEGSLCALGWLVLYGNDSTSLALADRLMRVAADAWPGADEVYMVQTSTTYAEMINLDRFSNR